jgi:hypothetical protein
MGYQMTTIICIFLIFIGLVEPVKAQQPVVVVANPPTIVEGQSTTLTTTVLLRAPSGSTATLTTSETLVPSSSTTYNAAVGSQVSAPVNVTVLPAPPPPAAQWTTICETTVLGSSCPSTLVEGRGFVWKVPFDRETGTFVLAMSSPPPSSVSIYSDDYVDVSVRTNTITKRVLQSVLDNDGACSPTGVPSPGLNLPAGHPRGLLWYDSVAKKVFSTAPLCRGYTLAQTGVYNVLTHAMEPVLNYSFTGYPNGVAWGFGAEYVESYGKALIFLGDVWFSVHAFEFDSATQTFTNIGAQTELSQSLIVGADGVSCDINKAPGGVISTHCPVLRNAMGTFSDGTNVWLLGGFNNAEVAFGDLYRYQPTTHVMMKMAPSGPVPPTTQMAIPMCAVDSTRQRLVCLLGTNDLWAYSFTSNAWSQFSAAGQSTVLDSTNITWMSGRAMNYDPVAQCMIAVQSRGQSMAPDIRKLCFNDQ